MTSSVGDVQGNAVLLCRRRLAGFTLVEILIVMAIIAALAGIVLVALGSIQRGARERSTQALIERLETWISDYYRKTGKLPPDGIDTPVKNEDGVPLESSAALYYALARPIEDVYMVAGVEKARTLEPIADFDRADITEDPDNPGVFFIRDSFGEPLHYDNLKKREDPPAEDGGLGTESSHGRWKFPLGYEIWSIGMRLAAAEEDME